MGLWSGPPSPPRLTPARLPSAEEVSPPSPPRLTPSRLPSAEEVTPPLCVVCSQIVFCCLEIALVCLLVPQGSVNDPLLYLLDMLLLGILGQLQKMYFLLFY